MKSQLEEDTEFRRGLKWKYRDQVFDTQVTMAAWLTRFHLSISQFSTLNSPLSSKPQPPAAFGCSTLHKTADGHLH